MAKPLTPLQAERLRVYLECGSNAAEAARVLGIAHSTMRDALQKIRKKGHDTGRPGTPQGMAVRSDLTSVSTGHAYEADMNGPPVDGRTVSEPSVAHRTADAQPTTAQQLGKVSELFQRSGIDAEDLARVDRVNLWQGFHKGEDGEAQIVDLVGVQAKPKAGDGPAWPVVQPGPAVEVHPVEVKHRARSGWGKAVILPDVQIGYWRGPDESLIPMHDEAALDVTRQVIRTVQPDVIVMVGDNLDFPELGRFIQTPGFARTTQAAIDRRTLLAAQLRADAGEACEIVEIEGNHEMRLPRYLLNNAMAAFGLRRGGDRPDSWPVMTVPFLCRYDETRVNYIAGYPAAEFWLNEGLRFVHGSKVRSGGSTAHAYLKDARHSTAFGHVHRIERAHITRHTRNGPRTVGSYCFGCLCRIDGRVPSAKSGLDHVGLPVGETEDWQQGFGLVEYEIGGVAHSVEQFEIWNGWTRFRGQELVASVDVNGERVT